MLKHRWSLECRLCSYHWSTEKAFTKKRVRELLGMVNYCPNGCRAVPNALSIIEYHVLRSSKGGHENHNVTP